MSELRWNDFVELCKTKKPSQFKPPVWEEVHAELSVLLGIVNDSVLHQAVVPLREKYQRELKSKQLKHSGERDNNNEVVLRSEDFNNLSNSKPAEPKKMQN